MRHSPGLDPLSLHRGEPGGGYVGRGMRSPVALPADPLAGYNVGLDLSVVIDVDNESVGHGCSVGEGLEVSAQRVEIVHACSHGFESVRVSHVVGVVVADLPVFVHGVYPIVPRLASCGAVNDSIGFIPQDNEGEVFRSPDGE